MENILHAYMKTAIDVQQFMIKLTKRLYTLMESLECVKESNAFTSLFSVFYLSQVAQEMFVFLCNISGNEQIKTLYM